jgi:hypothetical protein
MSKVWFIPGANSGIGHLASAEMVRRKFALKILPKVQQTLSIDHPT